MPSVDKPLVSVTMPVYNGERFLAVAIESILTQTFSDFELIVVDDGSQDSSADIARQFADRDDRIRFIQLERNQGHAVARNRAIEEARGQFIAGMDCDDISLPERLQMQVDFLQSHPEIGALGVGVAIVDEAMVPRIGWNLDERHAMIVFEMIVGGPAIVRGAIMIRRHLILGGDGYNSAFRIGPDFELFLRLVWAKEIKYANLPALLYIYRRSDESQNRESRDYLNVTKETARQQALEQLWGEAPDETLHRFDQVRPWIKLSWRDRRLARRDYIRLIESMIDHRWVDAADRSLLMNEVNRRLESTTPRLWQMSCHWWRHHFGPGRIGRNRE